MKNIVLLLIIFFIGCGVQTQYGNYINAEGSINATLYNYRVDINDDKMDEEKIKSYYLEHGILKKHWTKLPEDFDIKIYKKLNQDLETLDKNEITKQFVKIGHKTRIYK